MSTPSSRESSPVPEGAASRPSSPDKTAHRDGVDGGGALTGGCHPPAQPGTTAAVLRAAADFIESAGLHTGLHVICGNSEVRISVWEPHRDVTARVAIVAKLAALIGGTLRQYDNLGHPISDLRADGVIGSLRAAVKTMLPVRRTRPLTGQGRPLAESPGGQITAVPSGKLPEGWRWVTEIDAGQKRPASWKTSGTPATAQTSSEAPQPAACDLVPW